MNHSIESSKSVGFMQRTWQYQSFATFNFFKN